MRGDPRTIDDVGACDSEDDDENWMPAPSDADPGSLVMITILRFSDQTGTSYKIKIGNLVTFNRLAGLIIKILNLILF